MSIVDKFGVECNRGNLQIVKHLLPTIDNIDANDSQGIPAIIWAANGGHANVVQFLLQNKANVNAEQRDNSCTALWRAASNNHADVVRVLLDNNANIAATKKPGNSTPLYIASQVGNHDIVQILLDYHADINVVKADGSTCLHGAARLGHLDVLRLLIASGAKLNIENKNRSTALHMASFFSEKNALECVKVLCEANCDRSSMTPALVKRLEEKGRHDIARYFQSLPPQNPADVKRANERQEANWVLTKLRANGKKTEREKKKQSVLATSGQRTSSLTHERAPFFFPNFNSDQAELHLNGLPQGSFLARPSSQSGMIAISYVQSDRTVHHVLISCVNGYRPAGEGGKTFATLEEMVKSNSFLTKPVTKSTDASSGSNYGALPSVNVNNIRAPVAAAVAYERVAENSSTHHAALPTVGVKNARLSTSNSGNYESIPESVVNAAYVSLPREADEALSHTLNTLQLESTIRAQINAMLSAQQHSQGDSFAFDEQIQSILREFDQLKASSSSQMVALEQRMDAQRVHFESQIRDWTQSDVYAKQLRELEAIVRQNSGNVSGINANVAQLKQRLQSVAASNAVVRAHLEEDIRLAAAQREILSKSSLVVAFYRGLLQLFSAKLEAALMLATGMVQRGKESNIAKAGAKAASAVETLADNVDALADIGQAAASCIPIVGNVVGLLMRKGAEKLGDKRSMDKWNRVGAAAITSEDARRLAAHAAVHCTNQLARHIDSIADKIDEQKSFVSGRKAADTMYGIVVGNPSRFDQLLEGVVEVDGDLRRSAAALSKAVQLKAMESNGVLRRDGGIFPIQMTEKDMQQIAAEAVKNAGIGGGKRINIHVSGPAFALGQALNNNNNNNNNSNESVDFGWPGNRAGTLLFGACTEQDCDGLCDEYVRPLGAKAGPCGMCGHVPLKHKRLGPAQ